MRIIALERVRDAIIEGRIKPGERLIERTLAERLGVSRSVIREVIRNLESEGFIENTLSGPRLMTLSIDQAQQIYEIRLLLESSAAAACAEAATRETGGQLRAALDEIRQAHETHSSNGALRATTRFYQIIFETGGHDIAWEIVQRLNGRISQMRALTLSARGRQAAGIERLSRIVTAIEDRNPQAASDACREHIREASHIAASMLVEKQ
ncbi:GntR family transcriptional regulator [Sphingomonas bacterium]|uniref:GntR family transcriptional regulator n=1 Tax=Sphingomonas bacterium TaxID=1895847 RepID=UPI0020C5CFC6|nr:GntR family transcriptional regulator [Sphingomonas bacterium]